MCFLLYLFKTKRDKLFFFFNVKSENITQSQLMIAEIFYIPHSVSKHSHDDTSLFFSPVTVDLNNVHLNDTDSIGEP